MSRSTTVMFRASPGLLPRLYLTSSWIPVATSLHECWLFLFVLITLLFPLLLVGHSGWQWFAKFAGLFAGLLISQVFVKNLYYQYFAAQVSVEVSAKKMNIQCMNFTHFSTCNSILQLKLLLSL